MTDAFLYSTFALTLILACVALMRARRRTGKGTAVKSMMNRFNVAAIAAGLLGGMVYFYGALSLLEWLGRPVDVGHGEALIALPLLNLVFCMVLAVIGRIILQWEPMN